MVRIACCLPAVLLLCACRAEVPASPERRDAAPAASEVAAPAATSTVAAPTAPSATDVPAAARAAAGTPTPDGDRDLARLDGYGPLRFGMTAAEMREAWGASLHGAPPDDDAGACHYLVVTGADAEPRLAFMLEGGRFVRYDVSNDALPAPGGGRRGMTEAQLQALYRGALRASPHHYVEGGKYLAFDTSGVAPSRLVFETDAGGVVAGWRVGLSPQADYVEGCS